MKPWDLIHHKEFKLKAFKYFLEKKQMENGEAMKYTTLAFNMKYLKCKYSPEIRDEVEKLREHMK